MSTAVDFVPHSSGHNMLGAMARPLNGWVHEPSYTCRDGQPGQDHQSGRAGRLPGPFSLLSGSPPPPPPPPSCTGVSRAHAPGRDAYYYDYATPSPIQLSSPQTRLHGSGAYSATMQRQPPHHDARPSPIQSPATGDRPDETPGTVRLQQRNAQARPQLQAQVPCLLDPLQLRTDGEASRYHYATVSGHASQAAGPPGYLMPSPRPEPTSMSIANLLTGDDRSGGSKSDSKAPVRPRPETTEYKIIVRQQPVAARSCGFSEGDRRTVDPPPIVQLLVEDPEATPEELRSKIRIGSAVVHCSIWNEAGDQDNSAMGGEYRQQRRLMGTLVSSAFVGRDENGSEGCFFCFPDLSCRTPGSYRLKFALIILDVSKPLRPGSRSPIAATAMSDVFTVYSPKDFPGMTASTALTRRLKEQGCLISIKKGNERTNSTRGRDDSDEEEYEDEGPSSKRKKRPRKS